MWPILVVFYNLLPWLATRKFFVSLTMIIPGTIHLQLSVVNDFDFQFFNGNCPRARSMQL